MDQWHEFYGPNMGYVLELFERYQADPSSIVPAWRAFFDSTLPPGEELAPTRSSPSPIIQADKALPGLDASKVVSVLNLAQAIRWYGHWAARLDPLGSPPPGDPSLLLETYGLTERELAAVPASLIGGIAGKRTQTALEAIQFLRKIYSGSVGHDYLQIRNAAERDWLREAAESGRFSIAQSPIDPVNILHRLTQVEVFEHFLQRTFVAKTRFSIEGLDVLVPLLDVIVGASAESGIYNILIGMAHRGRLNLLAHILQKPIEQILAEFKDPLRRRDMQNEPEGWSGDVKYHAGASRIIDTDNDPNTIDLTIQMAPNPSHLEAVNPVIEGMARAAGTRADRPGQPVFNPTVTLPVVIHGDASFPGQGVVAETLNMYHLQGYETGGTIHIIANNQIGFTAEDAETRSTLFASDLAKGYRIPIIHINADDPEGAIMAARIAFAYRERFRNDFLIDLIGYRRLGHNEGDEPAFTQPLMYKKIEAHPTVRKIWADRLVQQGLISANEPERLYQDRMNALQAVLEKLDPNVLQEPIPTPPPPGAARKVQTAVPAERLQRLNRELLHLPEGFNLHPRLSRIRQRREKILDEPDVPTIDWAAAEEFALATILEDGIPIRLTGQDTERGTFSHRHAVLHDVVTGQKYIPLQAMPQARASIEVRNSPLSEYAALGFEYGYNVQACNHLVIWEAQYGDFINNAQTIVDEFVASGRDKWGQLSSLVMLLPHGYEGQGPDHSSGRLERFLNLAADKNLRIVNCTTAANYFHVLRRQAALLTVDPLPLVIMTPKSLLRHPLVLSPRRAFTEGGWQPVIDRTGNAVPGGDHEPGKIVPPEKIERLILCSGKIYVDLVTSDLAPKHPSIGIARVEQLAPFPQADVSEMLGRYPALEEVLWVQEEPENMGAWEFVRPFLEKALAGRSRLGFVARPASPSPAEGSNNLHTFIQRSLVERAFSKSEPASRKIGPERKRRAQNARVGSK
ncbi:MAG TPA: 2-oxoglutarate dehydrogenase E1 component [Anaerolineaceae bacterium]|nr:2-oxoglutarate dehydrogenase E1 component [Anaerolineaceae bacterium]